MKHALFAILISTIGFSASAWAGVSCEVGFNYPDAPPSELTIERAQNGQILVDGQIAGNAIFRGSNWIKASNGMLLQIQAVGGGYMVTGHVPGGKYNDGNVLYRCTGEL